MTDFLIANGADVNQVDQSGFGPLYYAIKFDRRGAFDKIVALKVNVNTTWKATQSLLRDQTRQ